MNFDIGRAGNFFHVKARGGESTQFIQSAALQQFCQRPLQRHLQPWVRAKTGKAALILRIQQSHVHHRKLPAQRGIFHHNAKACIAQTLDTSSDARIARNHFGWHIGQAQPFADDAEFDIALKNL